MNRADDLAAIRGLVHTYADVISRRTWDDLAGVLHPDVEIELHIGGRDPMAFHGRDAFVSFVAPSVDQFDFFVFQTVNLRVDLDGDDRATGSLHMSELRQRDGEFSQVHGHYADTFRRLDDRWWFTERRYRTLGRTAVPGTPLELF